MPKTSAHAATPEAETHLKQFLAKFDPQDQTLIRAVRQKLRKRFPTANEMVYDNYNFFVIGYSPTDRPSDAIVSIAAGASGTGLCFIHGAKLPDPKHLLLGEGKQTRFIRLPSASVLDLPDVKDLIDAAEAGATTAFRENGRGSLIIRSISKKQRPRRKPAK